MHSKRGVVHGTSLRQTAEGQQTVRAWPRNRNSEDGMERRGLAKVGLRRKIWTVGDRRANWNSGVSFPGGRGERLWKRRL